LRKKEDWGARDAEEAGGVCVGRGRADENGSLRLREVRECESARDRVRESLLGTTILLDGFGGWRRRRRGKRKRKGRKRGVILFVFGGGGIAQGMHCSFAVLGM
jgi:hypothetical protein